MDITHGRDDPLCITPDEARRIIHVSKGKMYELLRSGKIPYIRNGRRYLIVKSLLEDYIKDQASQQLPKEDHSG